MLNSCDESGDGINTVSCEYNAQNFIGPVTQINFANDANQIDTVVQSNVAQVSQNLQGVNDCDEENTGFNDVACENNDQGIFNSINQITQTNDAALVGDDTVQSNFIGVNQDSQTENACDETGLGDNDAFCINPEIDNTLGPVIQLNDADGSGDADFTQNNNIPIVNQVAEAENDCDQSDEQGAEGDNDAEVCQIFARNLIDSLSQTNDAEGTHVDDIFQDNQGAFSQVMTLNNDCDATTFSTSGDNLVRCITNGGNTIDEPVSQTNTATGLDDVLIDQDNNVAVFQDLSANNDCDATASNIADCTNLVQNFVDLVTQTNTATGDGFADISQTNNAPINQIIDLLNSCGESGDGNNLAQCSNDAGNLIGPVRQTNTATGTDNSVIRQFNVASVTQNMEGTNDCDEANTGFNNVQCTTNISNNIESITQSNEVISATGSQVHDQSNVLGITQNLVATNDCDESGLGDNNAICSITASNDIGAITQSNVASSNVLNINQDGQATNNCDDTTSGDNTAQCSIDLHLVVPAITQTGDETLNIDQHENLVNSCPGTGTCAISITRTFDPNAIQALLASTTTASASTTDSNADEEDEEETGSQELTLSSLNTAQADSDTGSALSVNNDDDNNNADDNTETDDGNSGTSTESTEKAESDASSDTNTVTDGQDNTGDDDTGDDDTGDDNTGDDNTGDDNTGDDNTGDDNTGDDDTGDDNTEDDNTGDDDNKDSGDDDNKDSGDDDSGDDDSGDDDSGDDDSGDDDSGDDDSGDDDGGDDKSDE